MRWGSSLFELLTGRRPFPIPDCPRADILNVLLDSRTRPPPAVRCWNKAVSPAIESIVRHCLEPDPDTAVSRRFGIAGGHRAASQPLRAAVRPRAIAPRAGGEMDASPSDHLQHDLDRHVGRRLVGAVGLGELARVPGFADRQWRDCNTSSSTRTFEKCQLLLNTTQRRAARLAARWRPSGPASRLPPISTRSPKNGDRRSLVRYLRRAERTALASELDGTDNIGSASRVALSERGGSEAEHRKTCRWGIDRLELVRLIDPRPPAAFHHDRAGCSPRWDRSERRRLARASWCRRSQPIRAG